MRLARQSQNQNELGGLLNPSKNRRGRRAVFDEEEEEMILSGMKGFASKGRSLDDGGARSLMAQIADDGRRVKCRDGIPSADAMRPFRVRHPELSHRRGQAKELAKVRGESSSHAKTCVGVLKEVFKEHPELLQNPEAVANVDEAEADAQFGKWKRAYGSSEGRGGGAAPGSARGPHATSFLAANAAGRVAPPFFLVSGKNAMPSGAEPLEPEQHRSVGELARFLRPNWMPQDAALRASANGSMEMSHIHLLIEHINRRFRKFAPQFHPLLLLLDGHSSRKGAFWLHLSKSKNIEVAQSPSDTTHFFQPCGNAVNKAHKTAARSARDQTLKAPPAACVSSKRLKLARAIRAHGALTSNIAVKSFEEGGLRPMDFRFLKRWEAVQHKVASGAEGVASAKEKSTLTRSATRRSDKDTFAALKRIVQYPSSSPAKTIQSASNLLRNRNAVNKIVFG